MSLFRLTTIGLVNACEALGLLEGGRTAGVLTLPKQTFYRSMLANLPSERCKP